MIADRTDAEPGGLPLVAAEPRSDRALWIGGAVLALAAILLFLALDARRRDLATPIAAGEGDGSGMIASPAQLRLPDGPGIDDRDGGAPRFVAVPQEPVGPAFAMRPSAPVTVREIIREVPRYPVDPDQPATPAPGPGVVFQAPVFPPPAAPGDAAGGRNRDRATASRLTNPGTTVPQGTVIPAVLETAMDSTRPGAVRAIISRDVRGFDGKRVLIQRGSRLYGEYNADLSAGQNRALVQWVRLIRPDGAVIALDSPSSDPLGRAGVRGKVNSHFFQRFSGAVLQSALDIGVGLATRSVRDDTLVLALPGATANIAPRGGRDIQPTLTVPHGTSVSVFVARDLDFTPVEN